jgi:hypothetical protein
LEEKKEEKRKRKEKRVKRKGGGEKETEERIRVEGVKSILALTVWQWIVMGARNKWK